MDAVPTDPAESMEPGANPLAERLAALEQELGQLREAMREVLARADRAERGNRTREFETAFRELFAKQERLEAMLDDQTHQDISGLDGVQDAHDRATPAGFVEHEFKKAFLLVRQTGAAEDYDWAVCKGDIYVDDSLKTNASNQFATGWWSFGTSGWDCDHYGWVTYDPETEKWEIEVGDELPTTGTWRLLFHIPWNATTNRVDWLNIRILHEGDVYFYSGIIQPQYPGDILVANDSTEWSLMHTNSNKPAILVLDTKAAEDDEDETLGGVRWLKIDRRYQGAFRKAPTDEADPDPTILQSDWPRFYSDG